MGYDMANTVNGVDVDKLNELTESIRSDPGKGEVEFRAETSWINRSPLRHKDERF